MSGREWKPGDVAMSIYGRVFRTEEGGGTWIYDDGSGRPDGPDVTPPTGLRPLVAIDPEDREQVERFADGLAQRGIGQMLTSREEVDRAGGVDALKADNIADALRELAKPTPPKCPAALIVKGEHFPCERPDGHGLSHRNVDAGAIWGEIE